ncbi:MAG: hypothetical protein FWK04_13995 [Nostoc sp. GBBB01]|nr:hypothetical protein [Nostoc sp. GBBB01]
MGRLVLSGAVGAASRREVWGDKGDKGDGEMGRIIISQSLVNSQQSTVNSQQSTVNSQHTPYPMTNL